MTHNTLDPTSPILAATNNNSRRPISAEHIRPQIATGNAITSDIFKRRPPFGVQQDLVRQPVRDRLLGYRLASQEFAKVLRERGLAPPAKIDGPLKGSDVCFLHEHRIYTSVLVFVNQRACMTRDKEPCTVLVMPAVRKKVVQSPNKRARLKPLKRGPDGRTTGDRLNTAMEELSRALKADFGEPDLVRRCNEIANVPTGAPDFVSQQIINQIRNGDMDGSRSSFIAIIAEAVEVRTVWLQYGFGPMKDDRALSKSIVELVKLHSTK